MRNMMNVQATVVVFMLAVWCGGGGRVLVAEARVWDGKMTWGGEKAWGGRMVWEARERTERPPPSTSPAPRHILKEHELETLKHLAEQAKEETEQESEVDSQSDLSVADRSSSPSPGVLRLKDLVLSLTAMLEKGWKEGQEEEVSKVVSAVLPPSIFARQEDDSQPLQ